jgi:molybdopterin synthase sulfur carrier subunit
MSVKLLYFAALREQLGVPGETIALPDGVVTVGALREHLMRRGETWSVALATTKAVRVAVNQDMAQASTPVKSGDEVAFFPPVTGG